MTNICLKCGHEIEKHVIEIIGNYEYVEINCQWLTEEGNYDDKCNCDAGFGKVVIKKEFSQMKV